MDWIMRHPVINGIALIVLPFAITSLAYAEPGERRSAALGVVFTFGLVYGIGFGLVWLRRAIAHWRMIRRGGSPLDSIQAIPALPTAPAQDDADSLGDTESLLAAEPVLAPDATTGSHVLDEGTLAAPILRYRLGRPVTRPVAAALVVATAVVMILTWSLYISPVWRESSPDRPPVVFVGLLLVAPLLAPAVGGILLRSWLWVPAAAGAFATGGMLGLWTNDTWTMTNGDEMSLVWPTLFFFPGVPAFAAAIGNVIRPIRPGASSALIGTTMIVTGYWAAWGLCFGLASVT